MRCWRSETTSCRSTTCRSAAGRRTSDRRWHTRRATTANGNPLPSQMRFATGPDGGRSSATGQSTMHACEEWLRSSAIGSRMTTLILPMSWRSPSPHRCSAVWCSSRGSADGEALVGRNMDFSTRTVSEMLGGQPLPGEPPALSRPYLIETYPDEGHATIVSAVGDLTGCLDGINDQGLVAAMLADDESPALRPSAAPQAGLNEMHLLRYLLRRARVRRRRRKPSMVPSSTTNMQSRVTSSPIPIRHLSGSATRTTRSTLSRQPEVRSV